MEKNSATAYFRVDREQGEVNQKHGGQIVNTFQAAITGLEKRVRTRMRSIKNFNFQNLSNLQKVLILILLTTSVICVGVFVSQRERLKHMNQTLAFRNNCTSNPCLNGGKCTVTEGKRECECVPEFTGNSCQAKNECVYPGTCPTVEVSGKALCQCRPDYLKDPHNSTTCKLEIENASLIFGSNQGIEQFSLKENSITTLVKDTNVFRGLDYLYRTKTVFWSSENSKIYKAQMDRHRHRQGDKILVVNDSGSKIFALAVDWIYSRLYFTEVEKAKIFAVNLDGTMKKVIIKDGLSYPTAIVVNPLNGWMYWADEFLKQIERSGLDGSRREVILNTAPNSPYGLTFDLTQNRLFWTKYERYPASIHSMNPDGSDVKLIFQAAPPTFRRTGFTSITTFDDSVYWRDYPTHFVYKANKCNGSGLTKLHSTSAELSLLTIQAYHFSKQPEGHNYCLKRTDHCSHLCFPTPSTSIESEPVLATKCACPDGLALSSDQLNCS